MLQQTIWVIQYDTSNRSPACIYLGTSLALPVVPVGVTWEYVSAINDNKFITVNI